MPKLTTNCDNWTGEEITVEFEEMENRGFRWRQYDYDFELKFTAWNDPDFERIAESRGYWKIHGAGWSEPLGTIYDDVSAPISKGGGLEREGKNPVEAAVRLLCNLI